MKTYKAVLMATVLVVVFAFTARAGEIHTNGVVSPPPPPPTGTALVAEEADTWETTDSESLLTEIALNIIQLLTAF
jgi:hypothetical protein